MMKDWARNNSMQWSMVGTHFYCSSYTLRVNPKHLFSSFTRCIFNIFYVIIATRVDSKRTLTVNPESDADRAGFFIGEVLAHHLKLLSLSLVSFSFYEYFKPFYERRIVFLFDQNVLTLSICRVNVYEEAFLAFLLLVLPYLYTPRQF